MLFAKGVIFVEGLAEQLLIPCFAEYLDIPFDKHLVALVAVGGSTFKHFLPLFGAGCSEGKAKFALQRRVACVVDADPARKLKGGKGSRRKKCWPYQLEIAPNQYEHYPISSVVVNLQEQCKDHESVRVLYGEKTLEYDLVQANPNSLILVTPVCEHEAELVALMSDDGDDHTLFSSLFDDDTLDALNSVDDEQQRKSLEVASCYLACTENAKGEHSFVLDRQLRENLDKAEKDRDQFVVPDHIKEAIEWVCNEDSE